jgi:MFS transporter, DHA2 family, multidrug resistance protein
MVVGLSPLDAGLWLLPQNIVMVAGSLISPALARRIQPAYVTAAGLVIGAVGLFLLTRVDSTGGLPVLITGLSLASGGIALPMAVLTNLTVGSTPPEKAGSAASIMETSGEFGVALGVAALGTLGTVVYRGHLSDVIPAAVPTQLADAAREGITAAMTAVQQVPGTLGHAFLDGVRSAYTAGLNTVGGVGAVVFMGLAVLAATVLRSAGRATDPAQPAQAGRSAREEQDVRPVAAEPAATTAR